MSRVWWSDKISYTEMPEGRWPTLEGRINGDRVIVVLAPDGKVWEGGYRLLARREILNDGAKRLRELWSTRQAQREAR